MILSATDLEKRWKPLENTRVSCAEIDRYGEAAKAWQLVKACLLKTSSTHWLLKLNMVTLRPQRCKNNWKFCCGRYKITFKTKNVFKSAFKSCSQNYVCCLLLLKIALHSSNSVGLTFCAFFFLHLKVCFFNCFLTSLFLAAIGVPWFILKCRFKLPALCTMKRNCQFFVHMLSIFFKHERAVGSV